jgi:hypothetical protein
MRPNTRWIALSFLLAACGPDGRNNGDCPGICSALGYQECHDGAFSEPIACAADQVCDPNAGCVVCPPDGLYCSTDHDVSKCNKDGTGGTPVESCGEDVCSNGHCKTPCEAALDNASNVGCDFWAVDLDNEAFKLGGGASNDAAAAQFAIVVANDNDDDVTVTVTKNASRVGDPLNEQAVASATVMSHSTTKINLPQREVDGAMGQNASYTQNSGSGTFVSPHAFHVVSTAPVVVYQFNPMVQQFSNDASTLIPIQALGMDYVVIGYNTANPCGDSNLPTGSSIPDHTAITIVAVEDDTNVTVTATHPIKASGGDSGFAIPSTMAGAPLSFKLSKYTVVNLESEQPTGNVFACAMSHQDGDFTGSQVHSDKPIVVFTSGERGAGFGGATNIVNPPDWDPMTDDTCCTDHLEEQLFPVTALGKEFALARSPIRSTDPSWKEPDIFRVVATTDNTTITTNLPGPYASFTLNARQQKTFASTTGLTLKASNAVEVSSYLVSQHFVKNGYIGDPSQLLHPAAEQFRKSYVFLVPDSWDKNYIVLAKPKAAQVTLDGVALAGIENSGCVYAPIGTVAGTEYEQVTCPAAEGHHTVSSDLPMGLSVYGYFNVGSYAFVGGSDVKIINPIY